MKKCLFLLLLLFTPSVFADISVVNVEIAQENPIEYMDMNFLVDLNNFDTNITTGTIKIYIDTIFNKSKVFSLNSYEQKVFDVNVKVPNEGLHSAVIIIDDILPLIDENTENNSFDINFEAYFGYDFYAANISPNKTNPLPGEEITLIGTVENLGDLKTPDANIVVVVGSTSVFSDIVSINALDNYDFIFNYTVEEGATTFLLHADYENVVFESNELNNTAETQVTTFTDPDLYLSPDDVSYSSDTLYKNEEVEVSFKVKNIGGAEAQSFVTKAWSEEKTDDTLLLYSTDTLNSGQEKTLSFKYTPKVTGLHLFIIETDVSDIIDEANENNNEIVFSKNVEAERQTFGDSPQSHIVNLELFKSCKALISNGQIFYNEGITKDGAAYILKYRLIQGETIIMSGEIRETNDPIVKPGVTMNIVTIDEDFARLMLIYQNPESIVSTDCTEDVGKLSKDLEFYQDSYIVCKSDLDVEKQKYSSLVAERTTCETRASDFQEKWNSCLDAKTQLYDECFTDDLNELSWAQEQKTKFDIEKDAYQSECESEKEEKDFWISILGILLFISYSAFMYYYYLINKTRKGGY